MTLASIMAGMAGAGRRIGRLCRRPDGSALAAAVLHCTAMATGRANRVVDAAPICGRLDGEAAESLERRSVCGRRRGCGGIVGADA
jgi:hypothetical protein